MKARVQDLKSIIGGRIDGFVVNLRNTVAFAANPWRARWQLLDGRVQRMVLIGVAALALAILWAYAWLPATRGRALLAERIPVMSAQLASMRTQAAEIQRINSLPPVVTTRSALPLADIAGLQALFGANAKVTADDSRAFRIVIPAIAYTAWLDQLDSALGRYRLRVGEIKLKTLLSIENKAAEIPVKAAAPRTTATSAAAPAAPAAKPAEVAVEFSLVDDNDRQPTTR